MTDSDRGVTDDRNGGRLDSSATTDLLEQQQAMEQARLLERFRELRQWQLKQQEQLMQQQRSQLEILQQEQVKVRSMLTKDRESQWGSGKVIRQQGLSPSKTPPQRRPPLPANNELFGALMSLVGNHGNQDPLAVTMETSSSKSQASSLPMPVMYGPPDPGLDDTSTNPELFSSPGSRRNYQDEVDMVEDGVAPIPDNGSEVSDGHYVPVSRKNNFIRTQPFLGDMASDTISVRSDGSYVPPRKPPQRQNVNNNSESLSPDAASLLQTLLQTANADTLKQMLGLAQTERVVIPDQPRSMKPQSVLKNGRRLDFNNCATSNYRSDNFQQESGEFTSRGDKREQFHNTEELSGQSQGHMSRHSKVRHSDEFVKETHHDETDFNRRHYDLQTLLPNLQGKGHMQGHEVIEDDIMEEDSLFEDSNVQDVTVEEVKEKHNLAVDDRPIKSGLSGKKTFEQLLEEQMREEEEKLRAGTKDSPRVKKKPFLRKGQGLTRYVSGKTSSPRSTEQEPEVRQFTESKPVPKQAKTVKPAQKAKKSTQPVRKEQNSSSQAKVPKKELSPRQKPQAKVKHSPRQLKHSPVETDKPSGRAGHQKGPKHSTPTDDQVGGRPKSHVSHEANKQAASAIVVKVPSRQKSEEKEEEEEATDHFPDDASFVSKIRKIQENKKVEQDELEVFELLEDFADNVSFCSNSSVVSRLLQRGRDENTTSIEGVKAVIEAKKAEKEMMANQRSTGVRHSPVEQSVQRSGADVKDNSLINGVDLDTSSDTITESSSSSESSDELDDFLATPTKKNNAQDNVSKSYEALFNRSQEDGFVFVNNNRNNAFKSSDSDVRSSVPLTPTKALTRKIASKDPDRQVSDTQSILNRLAATADDLTGNSTEKQTSNSVDKQAIVNEMFGENQTSTGVQHQSESSSDESEDSITRVKGQIKNISAERAASPDFDDEEEWTVTAPQTQVAMLDKDEGPDTGEKSTPPTSRLVARLFPKLKNANQQKQVERQQQEQQKLQAVSKTTVGDGVQSKILRDKLAELEKEIEKFRNENAALEKLRKDREELLNKLKQEICDFEQEKDQEVKRLEEFRSQEMKKLRQERKLFEQHQKTVRAMPDKREREEIEALKKQLSELQEEVKKKEGRWTSANNRLRQRLEVVEMENQELKEEIKILERRRLDTLQRESQKKNGVQKSFPRSSTPTEDLPGHRSSVEAARALSTDSSLKPPAQSLMNNSLPRSHVHPPQASQSHNTSSMPRPSQHSLAPSTTHTHNHNMSGDAIPRGQPSGPASVPRSDSQSPDDASSTGAVVNIPRKQSAKFSSENPAIDKGDKEYEESQYPDGKVERTYSNGAREILFANGTRKEISSDGQSIVVSFFNGDMKQIFPDQRVVYFYADAQTTHTTYPDGLEILQFQNNQIEKHYPDGTKEITFPDQTIKYLFPNGSEESIFPDGTVIRVEKNGDKTMEFPNGQREIHTEAYKRREYPDGTVKTVYPDGRQETRYSTGRIRLKDKDGNVIMDRMY